MILYDITAITNVSTTVRIKKKLMELLKYDEGMDTPKSEVISKLKKSFLNIS